MRKIIVFADLYGKSKETRESVQHSTTI